MADVDEADEFTPLTGRADAHSRRKQRGIGRWAIGTCGVLSLTAALLAIVDPWATVWRAGGRAVREAVTPTAAAVLPAERAASAQPCDLGLETLLDEAERARGGCAWRYPRAWPSPTGRSCKQSFVKWQQRDAARRARVAFDAERWVVYTGNCTFPPLTTVWPACTDPRYAALRAPADEEALSAVEQWRVRRYLGALGTLLEPPRTNGTRGGTGLRLPVRVAVPRSMRRCASAPGVVCESDMLLAHSLADARACAARAANRAVRLRYARDLACLLEEQHARRSGSAGSRRWMWMAGDRTAGATVPLLCKTRDIAAPGLTVLAPVMHARHATELRRVVQLERLRARPFLERERCAVWRGATTGSVRGWDDRGPPNPRRALVERWAAASAPDTAAGSSTNRTARPGAASAPRESDDTGGVRVDVGYSKLVLPPSVGAELRAAHARHVRAPRSLESMSACRYLLSVEGNDVATNLKWTLFTESAVLMAPPRKESWLLEAALAPWVHYVPIRRDAADLGAKLRWCEAHPRHARQIARAGRTHVLRVLGGGLESERRVRRAVLAAVARAVEYVAEEGGGAAGGEDGVPPDGACAWTAADREQYRADLDRLLRSADPALQRHVDEHAARATRELSAARRQAFGAPSPLGARDSRSAAPAGEEGTRPSAISTSSSSQAAAAAAFERLAHAHFAASAREAFLAGNDY